MADCPYAKIAVMQLFYELKQKFPAISDQVLSDFMRQTCYNREECERKLLEEYQRFQLHSYPISIAEKMTEGRERPKTLSLSNNEINNSNGLLKLRSVSLCIEEQQKSGCVIQDALGSDLAQSECEKKRTIQNHVQKIEPLSYHKTAFSNAVNGNSKLSNVNESLKNNKILSSQPVDVNNDLRLYYQNGNCGCEKTNFGISHSAPTTPSSCQKLIECNLNDDKNARKHRSSLDVDRSLHPRCKVDPSRASSTKVVLTLRPPSTENQPPINIATKGSQLKYYAESYDAKLGYQNQLQICIGDDGNPTLTASRSKTDTVTPTIPTKNICKASIHDSSCSLLPELENVLSSPKDLRLQEQKKRKERLLLELNRDKRKLLQIQKEVAAMEEDLKRRRKAPLISEKVIRLRAEVAELQAECQGMLLELEGGSVESASWTCKMCTFRNHHLLPKCEQCDMARIYVTRNSLSSIMKPPTPAQLPALHPHV